MFFGRNVLSGRNAGNERNAREAGSGWKLGRSLASGLLAVLAALVFLAPSTARAADKIYTDNGNGTVTDPVTQLSWMRCAMGQVWDGRTCTGNASSFNVTTAAGLTGKTTFAGQTDWRVPSIRELLSIVDRTRLSPSIDTEAFPNTPFNGEFLSFTASATSASVRWTVSFEDSAPNNIYSGGFIRLVRGGQSTGLMDIFRPTADYVANADGTATHKPTNLTWQRCAVGRTWTGSACTGTASILTLAQATALNSNFAGKTDWRLPTVDELESLTNYTNQTNVLNSTIFRSSTGTDFFWSSSQYLRDIANNWFLRTDSGDLSYTLPTSPRQVLLVRTNTITLPAVPAVDPSVRTLTDNGNGTVTDPVTQLTWMRCAMGQVWDGRTCTGTAKSFDVTTSAALNGTTTFAEQTDWRVPSIRELLSIVDRTRLSPSIDTEAFPNTPFNGEFLSFTASATSASVRWTVSFEDSAPNNIYSGGFIRLVRGGQSTGLMDIFRPTADYVANADGTATHKPTNLTWQRCAVGRTWTGSACTGTASILTLAQATALNSNFAGKTDWRLPTVDELESLTNYTNQTNVLNSTIFRSSTGTDFFWSSSQYLRDIANNWFLRTDSGDLSYTLPTSPRHVLLVRSETSTTPVVVALTGISLNANRLVIGSTSTVTIRPLPISATLPTCLAKSASGLTSSLVQISGVTVSLTAVANTVTAAETVTIQCGAYQTILTVAPNTNTIAIQMLVGPAALQSGGRTTLTATAVSTFADGTTRAVSPTWSSSNAAAASVSAAGVLSAGSVTVDTPVTLTASFTDNGVTTSGTLQVTITAAPATLSVLQISGASTVQSGGQMRLIANAKYNDGSSKAVFATSYALSNPALGSVNSRGVCSVVAVTVDTSLTVTATYVEGGVSKTASLPVTITAAPAVLSRLTLIGASALLASGQSLNLSALGVYADTSSKPVAATWQVTGTAATVSSTGVFKAMPVSADTPVIVSANYSEAGVAVTAQFQVIIQATASVSPIQAEVQATGTKTNFGLALWTSASSIAASAAPKGPGHASAKSTGNAKPANTGRVFYKLFVAAVVPGGDGKLVPLDTVFTLNRNSDWQALGFPVAEYLNGVAEDSVQLIDIFDKLDVSIISGTKIFVGYGIDDQEMISSGRFRLVYQLQ